MTDFDLDNATGWKWDSARSRYRRSAQLGKTYKTEFSGSIPAPFVVVDKASAMKAVEMLEAAKVTAIDSEYYEDGTLVCWQFSTGTNRVLVPLEHTTKAMKAWLRSDAKKLYHNAAADLLSMEKAFGFRPGGFWADTMVLDWLVDENRRSHGLKSCMGDWLGIPHTEFNEAFSYVPDGKKRRVQATWEEILSPAFYKRFVQYSTLDAYGTYWLYRAHRAVLERLEVNEFGSASGTTLWTQYQAHDKSYTETLTNMRTRGFRVDVTVLKQIGVELGKTLSRTRHAFANHAPAIKFERVSKGEPYVEIVQGCDINLKSPAQLAALFYDELGCETIERNPKTKQIDTSCRSTDKSHLESWATQGTQLAEWILEHRQAQTMRGTFIGNEGEKGLLSHVRGKVDSTGQITVLYTELAQVGTVTGRLASYAPNLQNIPARKEKDPYRMRRAFIARTGAKLIVADYSNIELRVMAHISRDKHMMDAFANNEDLHSKTAKRIFKLKCAVEEVKKLYPTKRDIAKAINFGLQYGMKAGLLSRNLGISREEAQRYIDAYFDYYDAVYRWTQKQIEVCRQRGYVTTLLGRRRRIPNINLDPDKYYGHVSHAENQAMNAPIQGSVADIIKIAMNQIECDPDLRDHDARLLLQVHDELIVEAPWIDADYVRGRVINIMENAYTLRVALPVEAHIGDNWEEAKG